MFLILRFFPAFLVLALGLVLAGCHKGKSNALGAAAFDNATPEIKDAWAKAVTADNANDYVTAVLSYKQILAHQADIPEAQYANAKESFSLLNQRLVNSALKGDEAAKQALDTLRKVDLHH